MSELSSMSLEQLTERKTAIKRQVDALHEEARAVGVVQSQKILDEHVERARESMQAWADTNGKTLAEAIEYWEGRLVPESGDKGRWVQSLLLQGKEGKVPF